MLLSLGYHIHKTDNKYKTSIERGLKLGKKYGFDIKNIQIYVIGPNNSFEILTDDDKKYFKKLSDTHNILIHASHLDHILGTKHRFTLINIKKEFDIYKEIGALALIVHIPDKNPKDIVSALDDIMKSSPDGNLYLEIENYHKMSKYNYAEISNIKKLFKLIRIKDYSDRIGLCVDTAHLWTSGIEIDTYDKASEWIDELTKSYTGKIIIQLNDQKWEFNSGSDEHKSLTKGTIWREFNSKGFSDIKKSGIMAFIDWAIDKDIVVMLERKKIEQIEPDLLLLSKII